METKSIIMQILSVPCSCHCRYCLLSWNNHPVGADYERCKRYAEKFHEFILEHHPKIQFDFTFGYSMDHPNLLNEIDFLNTLGSVQGKFLQLDGLRFRSEDEIHELMRGLSDHGVEHVNFTFYGLQAYHDRFSGRQGDFSYLLKLAESARKQGIDTSAGIPLTSENAEQAEELISLLEEHGLDKVSVFIPHEEGRGVLLAPIRFSLEDFAKLGPKGQSKLNRKSFRPECEWVGAGDWPEEQNRSLIISLTPDNIQEFEQMACEDVILYVERLDDAYYAALPTFRELCRLYGDPNGTGFYSKRDLFRHFQKLYIAENKLSLYDVTDERYCGSRRF